MEEKKRFLVKVCIGIDDFEDLENKLNEGYKITTHEVMGEASGDNVIYTLELKEPEEAKVTSIKSIDINEADELIKQGYEVKESFAKNVTLVLRQKEEKKETQNENL